VPQQDHGRERPDGKDVSAFLDHRFRQGLVVAICTSKLLRHLHGATVNPCQIAWPMHAQAIREP